MLKYFQKSFSSMASAFASIKQTKDENAISLRIEESLKSEVGNHTYFANAILKNKNLKAIIKCNIA